MKIFDPKLTGSIEIQSSVKGGITASLFGTASWAQSVVGGSGQAFPFTGSAIISGSLTVTGSTNLQSVSASNAIFSGTVTAQTLVVQTITSSVSFITGSTKFGSESSNTHQFTGSVSITGSLTVIGPATINNLTGSLFGTSSWSQNSVTASFVTTAQTASYVQLAQTASYVQTAQTASYVLQAVSSSFASTASFWLGNTTPYTGSRIVSGSMITIGPNTTSGSLLVTGSATVIGPALVTGSLIVSGANGAGVFSKGLMIAGTTEQNVTSSFYIWRAPFPARVVSLFAIKSGSANVVVNAKPSGSATLHLTTAIPVSTNNTWSGSTTVQNTDYAIGQSLELIVSGGAFFQTTIQVDFLKI